MKVKEWRGVRSQDAYLVQFSEAGRLNERRQWSAKYLPVIVVEVHLRMDFGLERGVDPLLQMLGACCIYGAPSHQRTLDWAWHLSG